MKTETLNDVEAEAMVINLAAKLAQVKVETVGDTLGNVDVNALVHALDSGGERDTSRETRR